MSNTNWLFSENKVGRWEGINDGDAQHFIKNPIGSLAREIIQNSLDAKLGKGPVTVLFDHFSINASDFPNLEQLKDKLVKASQTPKIFPIIVRERPWKKRWQQLRNLLYQY